MICVDETRATTEFKLPAPTVALKLYAPAVRPVTGVVCPKVLTAFERKVWNDADVAPESNWVTTEEASTCAL